MQKFLDRRLVAFGYVLFELVPSGAEAGPSYKVRRQCDIRVSLVVSLKCPRGIGCSRSLVIGRRLVCMPPIPSIYSAHTYPSPQGKGMYVTPLLL